MTPILHRARTTLALGLLCAAPLGHSAYAASDNWPERPIHLVSCCVGIIENTARVIGEEMAKELAQSIVVESKPGASGMIAAEYISRAKPDGYNVFVGTNSSHGANQSLFKQVPYDFVKDFTPIGGIASGKIVLVVGSNSPIHSVAELTAYSKENPGKLDYGWASSSTRVAMEMYKQLADVKITDVPYKTNPQATMDVAGGQIDLMFADLSTAVPMIQSGKLRALAISGTSRVDA